MITTKLKPRGLSKQDAANYLNISIAELEQLQKTEPLLCPRIFWRKRVYDRKALNMFMDKFIFENVKINVSDILRDLK